MIPLTGCYSASAVETSTEFKLVARLDSTGEICLEGSDCHISELLKRTIDNRASNSFADWMVEHVRPHSRSYSKPGFTDRPSEWFQGEFADLLYHPEGFDVLFEDTTFRYQLKPCKVFDCYRAFLSRVSSDGGLGWNKKVPVLEVPVVPFFADGLILYIGGQVGSQHLVAIDANTGEVKGSQSLPEDGGEFSINNPPETLPAIQDGLIVVQGCEISWPDLRSNHPIERKPLDIFVYSIE